MTRTTRRAALALAMAAAPLAAIASEPGGAGDGAGAPEVFVSRDPGQPEFIRFSPVVRVGDMLYLSGVTGPPVARDADDAALTANFVGIFEEVKARLARAGATFDNVVTVETYRLDYLRTFPLFNEVKNRYILAPYPTWTDVGISELPPGAMAELVVTAWLGGTRREAAE